MTEAQKLKEKRPVYGQLGKGSTILLSGASSQITPIVYLHWIKETNRGTVPLPFSGNTSAMANEDPY